MTDVTDRIEVARPRRFCPYPEYRDSGVEWLAEVPEHWTTWKASHGFRRIGSGTTPKSDDPDYYDGNIPWVTTSELRETIISDTKNNVTPRAMREYPTLRKYPKGTLLFAMYGATIGRLGILGIDATVNQACVALAEPLHLATRFVYYWLQMRRPTLIVLSAGGGQPNLSQDNLRQLRIPAPPLAEQRAIAEFLNRETAKIDGLVARKERLIELLQEKRTALITRAVTRGLDPNVPMKDSGVEWLGEIPAHWEPARLWRLCSTRSGATPTKENPAYWNGEIPWVSPKDMKRRVIATSEDLITQQALDETGIKLITPQVVLVVVRGMILTHSFPVAVTAAAVTINQDMKALTLIDGVEACYFAWALDGLARGIIATVVEEAAHGTRAIRMDQWRNLVVPLPPYPEQHAIAAFLDSETTRIDALINRIKRAIDLLKEFRTALISAAVTGKIDVRTPSAEATAGQGGTR